MKKLVCFILIFAFLSGLGLYAEQTKTEKQEETKTAKTACLKVIGGYWYAYMDFNGPYPLINEKVKVFREEFKKQGLKKTGSIFITFYNSPKKYKGDELNWAISIPVDKDADVKEPMKKKYLEPVESAYIEHKDDPKKIWDSFHKVEGFMEENNYDTLWPAYEVYNKNPATIEVIHPVIKKDKVKKK